MKYNEKLTRILCLSTYYDFELRSGLINAFLNEKYKAANDSYGINFKLLFKHTLLAKKRVLKNQLSFFILSIVVILLSFILIKTAWVIILVWLVSNFIFFTVEAYNHEYKFIKNNLTKETFDFSGDKISISEKNKKKVNDKFDKFDGNVHYYDGENPFFSSGVYIGSWSFVIDIDNGKKSLGKEYSPELFELKEMYDFINAEFEGIDLKYLSIYDKLFVDGKTIKKKREFLPDILASPMSSIPEELLIEQINDSGKHTRFYKLLQIMDWDDDLTLNIFFRIKKLKKVLYIESTYRLLPPIDLSYRIHDIMLNEGKPRKWRELFFDGISNTFISFFGVIYQFFKYGFLLFLIEKVNERIERKIIKEDPIYNYGSNLSIRNYTSRKNRQFVLNQFLHNDRDMYLKVVQKRLLNAVEKFLDSKNIDTSDLKERETNILNNGVIMTGGDIKTENFAVGKKATISKTENSN